MKGETLRQPRQHINRCDFNFRLVGKRSLFPDQNGRSLNFHRTGRAGQGTQSEPLGGEFSLDLPCHSTGRDQLELANEKAKRARR